MFEDIYAGLLITLSFLTVLGIAVHFLYKLNQKESKNRRKFDRLSAARLTLLRINEEAFEGENHFGVCAKMLGMITLHIDNKHKPFEPGAVNKYRYRKMTIANSKEFYVLINDLANEINKTVGIEYFDHRELTYLYR